MFQVHLNRIATTDLKPYVLRERASQSSEIEHYHKEVHFSLYNSVKGENIHHQDDGNLAAAQESLVLRKNAARPIQNVDFYNGATIPKILNVLNISNLNLKLNPLFRILDVNSKELHVIDTGSTFFIFKVSADAKKEHIGFVTAAKGSQIRIFNTVNKI